MENTASPCIKRQYCTDTNSTQTLLLIQYDLIKMSAGHLMGLDKISQKPVCLSKGHNSKRCNIMRNLPYPISGFIKKVG